MQCIRNSYDQYEMYSYYWLGEKKFIGTIDPMKSFLAGFAGCTG